MQKSLGPGTDSQPRSAFNQASWWLQFGFVDKELREALIFLRAAACYVIDRPWNVSRTSPQLYPPGDWHPLGRPRLAA